MPRHNRYQPRTFTSALPTGSRVLVYCRYSGEAQDDRSQRMALEEAIRANDWRLVEWYQDDARGGSSDRRPGFQALVAACHETPRRADGVVAWKGDRFSRDELDAPYYKADLRRRGYILHFLKDDIPDGPMARIFESLLEWKAGQDLRDISANTVRGQQAVVRLEVEQEGKTVTGFSSGGLPPKGYRRSAPIRTGTRRTGTRRTGTRRNGDARYNVVWEPDPALWPVCRRAIELLLQGDTYARVLEETGLFRTGGTLSTWLRSPALYGRRVHGETIIEDAHERLVRAEEESALLARLGQGLERGRHRDPRRVVSPGLLSGLLVCGYCREAGRTGSMQWHESGSGRWYRCAWRKHGGACASAMVPAEEAERLLVEALLEQLTVERFRPYADAFRRATEERAAERARLARTLPEALAQAQRRVQNLTSALADEYSPTLRRELATAETALAYLRRQQAISRQDGRPFSDDDLAGYVEQLRRDLAGDGGVAARREVLGSLVERIQAFNDRLAASWYPLAGKLEHSGFGLAPRTGASAYPLCIVLARQRSRRHLAEYGDLLLADRAAGMTYRALGDRYGVSESRAWQVAREWPGRRDR